VAPVHHVVPIDPQKYVDTSDRYEGRVVRALGLKGDVHRPCLSNGPETLAGEQ
jgi:hypothetical protein